MRVKLNTGEDIDWTVMLRRALQDGYRVPEEIIPSKIKRAKRLMREYNPGLEMAARSIDVPSDSLDYALWRSLGNQAEWDQRWENPERWRS